jgi:hypothetical protein
MDPSVGQNGLDLAAGGAAMLSVDFNTRAEGAGETRPVASLTSGLRGLSQVDPCQILRGWSTRRCCRRDPSRLPTKNLRTLTDETMSKRT